MPKTALPFVACLLALAAAGASAQSYWKWRDANGTIHMSDSPPPSSVPAKDVLLRPVGGVAVAPAPTGATTGVGIAPAASGADADLQRKKARADQEKADKAAADKAALDQKNAALRADNCQRAQTQAKALDSGVRIARLNANGEREYLDDAARAAELRRTQDIIAQSCGPATP